MWGKIFIISIFINSNVNAESLSSGKYFHAEYDDSRNLLDDPKVNPILAAKIKIFLDDAKAKGYTPIIHEVYRTRERAKELSKKGKSPASKYSLHIYGLAVDIWMKNGKGINYSHDPVTQKKDSRDYLTYSEWISFIKIGEKIGLINGYKHDDTDHWEFHPKWGKADWVSGAKFAEPVYKKSKGKTEYEKLKDVWDAAGVGE